MVQKQMSVHTPSSRNSIQDWKHAVTIYLEDAYNSFLLISHDTAYIPRGKSFPHQIDIISSIQNEKLYFSTVAGPLN